MTLGGHRTAKEPLLSILKPAVEFAYPEKYRLYITALQKNTRLEQRLLTTNILAADHIQLIPEMGVDKFTDFVAA